MSEFAVKLSERLSDVYLNVTRLEENALKESGINLTISEMHLLSFISKHKSGVAISDIADGMSITKPSVTVAVNKLVSKGYAVKEPDKQDGRVIKVRLTNEGRRVHALHRRCQSKVVSRLGDEFSPEQRDILLKAVDKLSVYFSDYKIRK